MPHHRGPARTLLLAVLLLAFSAIVPRSIAASVTIRNVPPTPHAAPAGTPLADLAAAIRLAADELGWRITQERPGEMQAALHVRTHDAFVSIGFDENNFWIDYRDSYNLDYSPDRSRGTKTRKAIEGPRIHRNYNKWVEQLATRISMHAKAPPKAEPPSPALATNPILIADELEKLDALRKRGVLSQDEFDRQKAKLLAY